MLQPPRLPPWAMSHLCSLQQQKEALISGAAASSPLCCEGGPRSLQPAPPVAVHLIRHRAVRGILLPSALPPGSPWGRELRLFPLTLGCPHLPFPLPCDTGQGPIVPSWDHSHVLLLCLPYPLLPSLGEGNGHPLQHSCLEKPLDRGTWQATVHGVARVGHDLVTKPLDVRSWF